MTALIYFTAKLAYSVVVADEATDTDADPQVKGINAGVTITAYVTQPPPPDDDIHANEIPAANLSPTAALVVLAPIDARLDNGRLMLRVAPDRVVHNYTSQAAFPATGVTTQLYWAADVDKMYEWKAGTGYVEIDAFAPVRLAAQTPVLQLPDDATLCYRVDFDHVTYGGADRQLPSFAFAAPTSDVVLDLATAPRVKF